MSYKLWKAVRKWAQEHEREAYFNRTRINLKCPHCNTWSSDAETESVHKSCDHEIATQYDCGQCNNPSYWVCEAGFWFTADEFGIEIPPPCHA